MDDIVKYLQIFNTTGQPFHELQNKQMVKVQLNWIQINKNIYVTSALTAVIECKACTWYIEADITQRTKKSWYFIWICLILFLSTDLK